MSDEGGERTARAEENAEADPCEKEEYQLDLNLCWADAAKARDEELKRAIKLLEKLLGGQEDKTLVGRQKAAQANWESYREAQCKLHQDKYAGGSMASMAYWICRYEVTRTRVSDVRLLAEEWSPR